MDKKDDQFGSKTSEFETWLISQGATVSPKIAVRDLRSEGMGRGVVATEPILEGEVLFTIPEKAILRAGTTANFKPLIAKHELDEWPALMAQMMLASGSAEWKPYFDVLPTSFNTPMFWSDSETSKLLKGSELVNKIDKEGAEELYKELKQGVLAEPIFANVDTSLECFHRMGSLMMAYAFDVPGPSEEVEAKAMIPLADLLNAHTKLNNARLTLPETEGEPFEMVAIKPIAKGEQVYNSYGELPSCDLLRRYGYVEAGGTDFEVVEIGLELVLAAIAEHLHKPVAEVEELAEERVRTGVPDSFVVQTGEDGGVEVDEELLVLLECVVAKEKPSKKEFKKLLERSADGECSVEALKLLKAVIAKKLREYPELRDLPAVNSDAVYTSKEDMAAQVLHSEVELLKLALDFAEC